MGEACLFCRILKGEIPSTQVGETEHTVSLLDAFPVSPGHTLILTKTHYETLDEVPPDVLADLGREAGRLSKILVSAFGYTAYNLLQNNGTAAGQTIPHAHWHLFGRKEGDHALVFHSGPKQEPTYFAETARKMKP
jgi:histidine triad (HIT) family protein